MNDLHPELKRLMRLARQTPPQAPPAAPLGFSTRVVALWHGTSTRAEFGLLQKFIWGSACAATAAILLGLAFLTARQLRPASFYELTPAYQVVSTQLVP